MRGGWLLEAPHTMNRAFEATPRARTGVFKGDSARVNAGFEGTLQTKQHVFGGFLQLCNVFRQISSHDNSAVGGRPCARREVLRRFLA